MLVALSAGDRSVSELGVGYDDASLPHFVEKPRKDGGETGQAKLVVCNIQRALLKSRVAVQAQPGRRSQRRRYSTTARLCWESWEIREDCLDPPPGRATARCPRLDRGVLCREARSDLEPGALLPLFYRRLRTSHHAAEYGEEREGGGDSPAAREAIYRASIFRVAGGVHPRFSPCYISGSRPPAASACLW
ncbi:hypothetical protein L1887_63294 [Cichorium endivia]|nr:hypothetical protein L1887_63294 [Cichorium endivia]